MLTIPDPRLPAPLPRQLVVVGDSVTIVRVGDRGRALAEELRDGGDAAGLHRHQATLEVQIHAAEMVASLLDRYAASGKPLVASEWGWWPGPTCPSGSR